MIVELHWDSLDIVWGAFLHQKIFRGFYLFSPIWQVRSTNGKDNRICANLYTKYFNQLLGNRNAVDVK